MSTKEERDPCIRCQKRPDENDSFCTNCGAPLQNRCSDEPGLLKKGCSFVNVPNAAYCAKCGEPTIFQVYGLITPNFPSANKPAFIREAYPFGQVNKVST